MTHLEVYAPFCKSLLQTYPMTSREQALMALESAVTLYRDRQSWLSTSQKIVILERLAELVIEKQDGLAEIASREGGKPIADSKVEIARAIEGIQAASAALPLTGREVPMGRRPSSAERTAMTYWEPRGVVFAISAFNHPFNLLIHQVVTALAAGCPVLLKPALKTPISAYQLVDLLRSAGLPEGYCQLLLTSDEDTGYLVSDSRIAFLNFIGSAKVGWSLRSALAPGASCLLEHGGVAPVIVDETANIDALIPAMLKGGFYHAGQVCVSVQRIYVPRNRAREIGEKLAKKASELCVGDPLLPETQVGPLIDSRAMRRVQDSIDEALEQGAELLCGGKALSATTFSPTILYAPSAQAKVCQEEVFGPVMSILPYDDIEEAIGAANLEGHYFQAALFTNRLDQAWEIGRRLQGTAVMVNDHTAFRVDSMPFGGHRLSGLGIGGIQESIAAASIERMIVFNHQLGPGDAIAD
ncbi:MAG: aldehyde dehydrogenase family protein [Polyangiaceae bacterium]|nr:aldehyde dehydrogenase family protein [Polyangiaceae bacterium]